MKQSFCVILLLLGVGTFAQQTDILGNTFFLQENVLVKNNLSKNKSFQYENTEFGDISSYDISNPFQILLFFEQFNSCIILDDKLSEILSINFDDYNIFASLICSSSNNGIWIYDRINEQILNLDIFSKEISSKKSFSINSNPEFIFEQNNYIILGTNDNIFILNNLCTILEEYNFKYKTHKINHNKIEIQNVNGEKFLLTGELLVLQKK